MTYSFVLIAYNEAANILACIQSIESLTGLGSEYEIVVFDDGSQDNTRQLVQAYAASHPDVRLIGDSQNHGRGFGRYSGVEQTTGQYVIMVDADIILPADWLSRAQAGLSAMSGYDMAGGIAVPDGDVAYIYRKFGLRPKTVMGSTTITGNNGIYKRFIFETINFDPRLRDGEDVDFNHRAATAGFRAICVPGLTVEHQEHKSFVTSMRWLYQSGIGATRQLIRFKHIRLPDLAFAAILGSVLIAIIGTAAAGWYGLWLIPILGIFAGALLHLRSKFYTTSARKFSAALGVDCILMTCYYIGRFVGFALYEPTIQKVATNPV